MHTLIIGYGNTLRGDDGVGPRFAHAVAGWNLTHVRTLSLHGLVPELADDLSKAARVIFADAAAGQTEVTLVPLTPSPGRAGHASDPAELLALAESVYGRRPDAYLLALPAHCFDFGEQLSPLANTGLVAALEWMWNAIAPARPGAEIRLPGCGSSSPASFRSP